MNVRPLLILPAALAALLAPVAASDAAVKRTSYPEISKIAPMQLAIGETLTITGRNFVPGRDKNTVVFKRDKQRAIFAKAANASSRRLTVVVPEKLRPYLVKKAEAEIPTKFRIRVLARRFGKRYTALTRSPVVAPAPPAGPGGPGEGGPSPAFSDCDQDGQVDAVDVDDDNDGMTDQFEVSIKTSPCTHDTDGDSMWDTWEYEAALDLNLRALPYPGKRPHPNPLDGSDAGMDWDGDGLWSRDEHELWQAGGRPMPLNYSDGDQSTGPTVDAPGAPNEHLDIDSDGVLTDDEKDFDGDRMPNWNKVNGTLQPSWWMETPPFKEETPYFNTYDGLNFIDPDTDGDGRIDGEDDQDFDGYDNIAEIGAHPLGPRPAEAGSGRERLRAAVQPCLPNPLSRSCSRYIPAVNADKPYPPFNGEALLGPRRRRQDAHRDAAHPAAVAAAQGARGHRAALEGHRTIPLRQRGESARARPFCVAWTPRRRWTRWRRRCASGWSPRP